MSSSGFSELIELHPPELRVMAWYGLAMSVLVVAAVVMAELPRAAKGLLLLAAGAGIMAELSHRYRHPSRLRRAVLHPDGTWALFLGRCGPLEGRLTRAWGRSAGPVIGLEWHGEAGERIAIWLLQKHMSPVTWRRLRVRLRLA